MPVTVEKTIEIGCCFWLQWLFATFGGFLASLFWIEIGETPDMGAVEGIIGGAVIGLVQSLVLKQHITQAKWWVIASILSWGLIGLSTIGAVGWVAPRTLQITARLFYGTLNGAKSGLLLGVAQWLVLNQTIPKAWRWIGISTLCWSLALAMGWVVGGALRLVTNLFLSEVIGLGIAWIVVGSLTGAALMNLLQEKPIIKL